MDTPACPPASAAMHLSADCPGKHQKGLRETSQGRPSAPHPHPIHQRTRRTRGHGSRRQRASCRLPSERRTIPRRILVHFSSLEQQAFFLAWTPPGSSEVPTNNSPTPSMGADEQDPRLPAQLGRAAPVVVPPRRHTRSRGHRILRRSHDKPPFKVRNRGHHCRQGTNVLNTWTSSMSTSACADKGATPWSAATGEASLILSCGSIVTSSSSVGVP